MNINWPILSVVTFLPLLGAAFIMLVRGNEALARGTARWVAMWTTLVTFAISLVMVWRFDATSPEFQFVVLAPCGAIWQRCAGGQKAHLLSTW